MIIRNRSAKSAARQRRPHTTCRTGACFVLGDNRDNSNDSRRSVEVGGVGFVPFDHIIGRAAFIYYSAEPGPNGRPGAPRPERIGEWVR